FVRRRGPGPSACGSSGHAVCRSQSKPLRHDHSHEWGVGGGEWREKIVLSPHPTPHYRHDAASVLLSRARPEGWRVAAFHPLIAPRSSCRRNEGPPASRNSAFVRSQRRTERASRPVSSISFGAEPARPVNPRRTLCPSLSVSITA